MTSIIVRRTVPYRPEQLFDVAADIEDYPNFLQNCAATRVVRQSGDTWVVDNVFRWGPVPLRFRTQAFLSRPHAIHIETLKTEPVKLNLSWAFTPQDEGTEVALSMALELDMPLIGGLMSDFLNREAEATQQAFLEEVSRRYGPPQSSKIEK